jgi:hypothetical protein
MAATTTDTQREISELRADTSAALEELLRRLRGGFSGIAGAEARVAGVRAGEGLAERVEELGKRLRDNPPFVAGSGAVALGALGYAAYSLVNRWRENRQPQSRLKRRVMDISRELGSLWGVSLRQVGAARRQLGDKQHRDLLLKIQPEQGGYLRVTDARLDLPMTKARWRKAVVKNLMWAGMVSLFTAVAGVMARRVAAGVWRATLREEPPPEKK